MKNTLDTGIDTGFEIESERSLEESLERITASENPNEQVSAEVRRFWDKKIKKANTVRNRCLRQVALKLIGGKEPT